MKKVLTLLFFIIVVLLIACDAKYKPVNGCEIRPKTECSRFVLSGTDLREANLHGADLAYTDLLSADLRGANLTWAHSNAELAGAKYNKSTKFHVGSDPEAAGMVLVE